MEVIQLAIMLEPKDDDNSIITITKAEGCIATTDQTGNVHIVAPNDLLAFLGEMLVSDFGEEEE